MTKKTEQQEKPKRKRLPEYLLREKIYYELPETEHGCPDCVFRFIRTLIPETFEQPNTEVFEYLKDALTRRLPIPTFNNRLDELLLYYWPPLQQ